MLRLGRKIERDGMCDLTLGFAVIEALELNAKTSNQEYLGQWMHTIGHQSRESKV